MAKRHKKNRTRGESSPTGQDLSDRQNALREAVDELERFSGSLIDKFAARIMAQLGKNISYKIVMSGASARLNSFDERAYDAYAALIGRYVEISRLYDQAFGGNTDEQASKVLSGVISILSSRVKFAEENGGVSGENPIGAEKNRLVSGLLQEFYKECKLIQKDDFFAEVAKLKKQRKYTLVSALDRDLAHEIFNDIIRHTDKLSRPIYPIYNKKCQLLVSTLNDLNLRTSANYYFRLIETEKDILESIVKIQLNVLERELDAVKSEDRLQALSRLLLTIRECYQLFIKDADQVLDALHDALSQDDDTRLAVESYDNYQADLTARLSADQTFPTAFFQQALQELPSLLSRYSQELDGTLQIMLEHKVSRTRLDHTLYELRKRITQSALMANEMADVFRKAHNYYKEHEELLANEPCIEIIAGIDETTSIKIMNIHDGKTAFFEDALEHLNNFMSDGRGFCETVLEGIQAEIAPKMLETFLVCAPSDITDSLENAFDNAFESGFAQKTDKLIISWQQDINKKILAFKREILLYEMGTFDEIMNFSVSKLVENSKESQGPSLAYASHLKRALGELIEILGRNGISRIMPQPHDPFDGKEHDVLMAERTEGFAKGEIVKTFSSGYREQDSVLVRASVIAAK